MPYPNFQDLINDIDALIQAKDLEYRAEIDALQTQLDQAHARIRKLAEWADANALLLVDCRPLKTIVRFVTDLLPDPAPKPRPGALVICTRADACKLDLATCWHGQPHERVENCNPANRCSIAGRLVSCQPVQETPS